MNTRRHFLSLVFCLLVATQMLGMATASAAELTVIDLRNRTAEEMLPVLRPLVGSEAALSGMDYKLFVRGSASDVARIREALAVLDRTPRQLLVSVRYNASPQDKTTAVGADGGIVHSGNRNSAHVGIQAGTTIRTASDSHVSSVRVIEGNGAHISTGQSVPIVTAVRWPRTTHSSGINGVAIDYRELSSGFDVMPRINGDRVILDIATQQERATNSGAASATSQRATTTVTGRLGEWIELGGVTSSIAEHSTSIGIGRGTRSVSTQSDQQSIEVKVEQVE